MGKPKRSGGKAAPYDHADGDESELVPAMLTIKNPDPLARGSELTPMRVVGMAELVSKGVPIPVAAGSIGIPGHAWKDWARNGRHDKAMGKQAGFGEGESKYLFWLLKMDEARCQFEAQCVVAIQTAAVMDWKAAAYLLERRASKRWHLQSKLEITNEAKSKLEITAMSTDKLIAIARGLLPAEDIKETKALPADIEDGVLLDDELQSDD